MTKRLKITNSQIDQQIANLERLFELKIEKALRDGDLTQDEVDQINNATHNTEQPKIGDLIQWSGHTYKIEDFTNDGAIVTKTVNTH